MCIRDRVYRAIALELDAMGKAKFFLGAVGDGTRMKLAVNMTMGSMLAACAPAAPPAHANARTHAKRTHATRTRTLAVCYMESRPSWHPRQ